MVVLWLQAKRINLPSFKPNHQLSFAYSTTRCSLLGKPRHSFHFDSTNYPFFSLTPLVSFALVIYCDYVCLIFIYYLPLVLVLLPLLPFLYNQTSYSTRPLFVFKIPQVLFPYSLILTAIIEYHVFSNCPRLLPRILSLLWRHGLRCCYRVLLYVSFVLILLLVTDLGG